MIRTALYYSTRSSIAYTKKKHIERYDQAITQHICDGYTFFVLSILPVFFSKVTFHSNARARSRIVIATYKAHHFESHHCGSSRAWRSSHHTHKAMFYYVCQQSLCKHIPGIIITRALDKRDVHRRQRVVHLNALTNATFRRDI